MTHGSLIAPARLARRPVLATQSDGRLVDLVRAGYEPAFETIVARYRSALLSYSEHFLSRERAEDAVQQAFVRAYDAMVRNDDELALRPWLYRIAHNSSLNMLRDRHLDNVELPESIDGVERPDQALERVQGMRDVLAAVQALPPRQRDAIVLRELEGRSYEEIASELGVSDGSVRQLLNRARNTLRAGATAVTPIALVLRLPWIAPAEPVAGRVAELTGVAGAGAVAAKVCATALVGGAIAGGAAVVSDRGSDRPVDSGPVASEQGGSGGRDPQAAAVAPTQAEDSGEGSGQDDGDSNRGRGEGEDRDGEDDGDRRGRGRGRSGEDDRGDEDTGGDDNSGSGSLSSGSGSGGLDSASVSSGSGSSSGPGSGTSGRSGSGSDSSGSSSSGSGSSGSGTSGSGTSGSGTSASGSGSSGSSGGEPEPADEGSGSSG